MRDLKKPDFDRLRALYPNGMQAFLDWVDAYKIKNDWLLLFNSCYDFQDMNGRNAAAPKYHDIPGAMQMGIWVQFMRERGGCSYEVDLFEFEQLSDMDGMMPMLEDENRERYRLTPNLIGMELKPQGMEQPKGILITHVMERTAFEAQLSPEAMELMRLADPEAMGIKPPTENTIHSVVCPECGGEGAGGIPGYEMIAECLKCGHPIDLPNDETLEHPAKPQTHTIHGGIVPMMAGFQEAKLTVFRFHHKGINDPNLQRMCPTGEHSWVEFDHWNGFCANCKATRFRLSVEEDWGPAQVIESDMAIKAAGVAEMYKLDPYTNGHENAYGTNAEEELMRAMRAEVTGKGLES